MLLDIARLTVLPGLMALAAASDLFTMTISNRISILLAVGFLALALAGGMPPNDILQHLAAGGIVLTGAFVCFAMGWVGGGDAKLAAAAALWFGFGDLLEFLAVSVVIGGAITLAILQFRQWPLPRLVSNQVWLQRLHETKAGVPYGIALAIGALMTYPQTEWMKAVDLGRLGLG